MEKSKILYHGSHNIIEKPIFGFGNPNNDYGLGFYCTEFIDIAKEWACDQMSGGYANMYSFDSKNLKILNLNSNNYSILHWLSILLKNRNLSLDTDMQVYARDYLLNNFNVDTDKYDVIIGYRADDSYFSFARDFLSNGITIERLKQVMKLGALGNQIVIKSKEAFSRLIFLGYEEAQQNVYFPLKKKRDELARSNYLSNKKGIDINSNSMLMIDIIRGGYRENDPRIQ